MRRFWQSRTILAGIGGAIMGAAAEALVNRAASAVVISDGLMWGAVLGIVFASLPSFTRMGYLTVRSGKPAVNFLVGVGVFILISVVGSVLFFGIFWLITRLLS